MVDTVVIVYDQAYISGGAAKIAIGEAVALKEKGYNVIFFSALNPVDKSLEEAGVKVVCIGGEHIAATKSAKALLNGLWNRKAKKELLTILSQLDKEKTVVHVHGWTKVLSASIFATCKKANIKTYITLHEYFTICPNGGLYDYRKDAICTIEPNCLKCYLQNCDKRNYVQKLYRDVRQVLTNGALKALRPNAIYITEFSKKLLAPKIGFANNSYMLTNHVEIKLQERVDVSKNDSYIFIGRMSREKGAELFCEAVTQSGVHGIVIGAGPQLEELSKKYPDIIFTGWMSSSDMGKYLQRARCLIVSSKWYETMGLTIIEMQSKGIPCIVPDNCAGSEYVEDKKTGLIYEIGNIESLKHSIEYSKSDELVEKMSKDFYDCLDRKKFSMEQHIEELVRIYNS